MLSQSEIENKLKQIKPILTDKFHVGSIGYFGSYVRNDPNYTSDSDLLVEFTQPTGWEFFT